MIKNSFAFGVGVTIGIIVFGAAVCYYYLHKKKNNYVDKEKETELLFANKLKQKENSAVKIEDLISNQTYVDFLSSKELTNWFKENGSGYSDNVKMIICIPTEDIIKGIGCDNSYLIDTEKSIMQVFYDDKTKKIVKGRLISYNNIDSNLQAHLIEDNGMLVVTA